MAVCMHCRTVVVSCLSLLLENKMTSLPSVFAVDGASPFFLTVEFWIIGSKFRSCATEKVRNLSIPWMPVDINYYCTISCWFMDMKWWYLIFWINFRLLNAQRPRFLRETKDVWSLYSVAFVTVVCVVCHKMETTVNVWHYSAVTENHFASNADCITFHWVVPIHENVVKTI
jgi:hypothetical protein